MLRSLLQIIKRVLIGVILVASSLKYFNFLLQISELDISIAVNNVGVDICEKFVNQ